MRSIILIVNLIRSIILIRSVNSYVGSFDHTHPVRKIPCNLYVLFVREYPCCFFTVDRVNINITTVPHPLLLSLSVLLSSQLLSLLFPTPNQNWFFVNVARHEHPAGIHSIVEQIQEGQEWCVKTPRPRVPHAPVIDSIHGGRSQDSAPQLFGGDGSLAVAAGLQVMVHCGNEQRRRRRQRQRTRRRSCSGRRLGGTGQRGRRIVHRGSGRGHLQHHCRFGWSCCSGSSTRIVIVIVIVIVGAFRGNRNARGTAGDFDFLAVVRNHKSGGGGSGGSFSFSLLERGCPIFASQRIPGGTAGNGNGTTTTARRFVGSHGVVRHGAASAFGGGTSSCAGAGAGVRAVGGIGAAATHGAAPHQPTKEGGCPVFLFGGWWRWRWRWRLRLCWRRGQQKRHWR